MNEKPQPLNYPRNPDEWRVYILQGLGLTSIEGESRFSAGTFPFDALTDWIYQKFGEDEGYSPDFISALIRNIKGLVSWIYSNGPEPYWPGRDEEE
ncbi:MAG: hypothetical protein JSV51_07380 [Candidatus Bathyarchaeota archaeon]|nr:MAG: hypothetical protein JSV51_07380 [Candidatus Bathyarchaeota archaeon]